jgi:hypothetical protein
MYIFLPWYIIYEQSIYGALFCLPGRTNIKLKKNGAKGEGKKQRVPSSSGQLGLLMESGGCSRLSVAAAFNFSNS